MKDDETGSAHSWDNRHFVHPWEGFGSIGQNRRLVAQAASGIMVRDETGRELMDGPGGMWCVQIGYGREEMAQAIAEQATQLSYFSPFSNTSSPSARLAREIAARTPGDLNRVFFTTGGSTAVDTALRFIHFRNNVLGMPEKKIVVSRHGAYHGSTYLAASVSGKERDRLWLDKAEELAHFLPDVTPSRRPDGMTLDDFLDQKCSDLETAILTLGADRVAAFIAEPVLASGGVIVPPEGYHKRCLEICRRHDVLYVSDEVVTGFGRLGHWFASEDVFGIVPDIITCAKGLTSGYVPMGATAISDRLVAEISGDAAHEAAFSNGYTYSGHPVAAAAALKNIEIIEREGLLEHARRMEPVFQERLHGLRGLPMVVDTRGIGLVGCVECSRSDDGRATLAADANIGAQIDAQCQELGLLVRPLVNMCVLSPPLVVSEDQIGRMFDILEQSIRLVAAEDGAT